MAPSCFVVGTVATRPRTTPWPPLLRLLRGRNAVALVFAGNLVFHESVGPADALHELRLEFRGDRTRERYAHERDEWFTELVVRLESVNRRARFTARHLRIVVLDDNSSYHEGAGDE